MTLFFKSSKQPLCRYCGKPIAKHAVTVRLSPEPTKYHLNDKPEWTRHAYFGNEPPKDKADLRRFTNLQILSLRYRPIYEDGEIVGRALDSFTEWDGESYVDEFFCNGDHAKRFGYIMARANPGTGTKAWAAAENERTMGQGRDQPTKLRA